jgi:hypothetical protein
MTQTIDTTPRLNAVAPDLLATLETLVDTFDEVGAEMTPEDVATILNYINVQCRNVIRLAKDGE